MTLDGHRVAVIGLGLIGGSIAKDLAARGVHVSGYDTDPETMDMAWTQGVVRHRLDASLAGLEDASVVVLAVPVAAMESVFTRAADHLGRAALVTDVGSTKRSIAATAARLGLAWQFVGSHPMAGDHRAGWPSARAGLFEGARVYLCPTPDTEQDAVVLARQLWGVLGARPTDVSAEAHDRLVALTSHLPHVAAAAIALTLARARVSHGELGPGGRDALRVAASSPDLWAGIALDNADCILEALAGAQSALTDFARALEARDAGAVRALFADARGWMTPSGAGG
jgi:prephenate dehydrogenase